MVFFRHVFFPLPPKLQEKLIKNKRHYISPNGSMLPSVTTVLSLLSKAGIDAWKAHVGEAEASRVSGRAMVNGTELHSIIEQFLDNKIGEASTNEVSKKLFEQMKPELLKINNIRAQEIQLYSEKLGVAGRVDCVAEYDGILSVIDFKSASKKKQKSWILSYFLQATCYAEMFMELTKEKIQQVVILVSAEDNTVQAFVGDPKEYIERLLDVIEDYKHRY